MRPTALGRLKATFGVLQRLQDFRRELSEYKFPVCQVDVRHLV